MIRMIGSLVISAASTDPEEEHPEAAHIDHFWALWQSLEREKARLAAAKKDRDKKFRATCVAQKEKEIAVHVEFLAKKGVVISGTTVSDDIDAMNDDELLEALMA